ACRAVGPSRARVGLSDRSGDELRRRPQRAQHADAARHGRAQAEEARGVGDGRPRPVPLLGKLGAAEATVTRCPIVLAIPLGARAGARPHAPKASFTERAFALARSSGERSDESAARAELDRLVRAVHQTATRDAGLPRGDALAQIVFE